MPAEVPQPGLLWATRGSCKPSLTGGKCPLGLCLISIAEFGLSLLPFQHWTLRAQIPDLVYLGLMQSSRGKQGLQKVWLKGINQKQCFLLQKGPDGEEGLDDESVNALRRVGQEPQVAKPRQIASRKFSSCCTQGTAARTPESGTPLELQHH